MKFFLMYKNEKVTTFFQFVISQVVKLESKLTENCFNVEFRVEIYYRK